MANIFVFLRLLFFALLSLYDCDLVHNMETRPCLRNSLFGIADPGVHRVGRSIAFFFFLHYKKKLEVSASNPFEMQAKLYAELTDDIFRYYSVP